MEGYTNVIGGQYDFDDLDIEGRVVDEWNVEVEEKNPFSKGLKQLDESIILSERVKLDNGQQSEVFSVVKKKGNVWYTCHVCSETVVGLPLLRQHVDTHKHRTNLNKPVHPKTKFVKLDPKENVALEPGEPVPPGLEEMIIKNCLIQPTLDAWKSSPLIGLEFLVELTQCTIEEDGIYYYCLLCDKTGGTRNILIHLTSIFHYMKYLSIYFPTVARKLHSLPNKKLKKSFGLLVTEIIGDIELKYGRMKPKSDNYSEFFSGGRKSELQSAVYEGPHIRELDGELFDEKATAENIEKKNRELQCSQLPKPKMETNEDENKELSLSLFNKNNRVDKKQLRSRDDAIKQSSPDVQIVDIQLPKFLDKKKRSRSRSISSLSTISNSSTKSKNKGRRLVSHSRHRQRPGGYHQHRTRTHSRSRSRSPNYRNYRRYSPSYTHRSPGRRSRESSPPRKWNRNRRDSRGYSPDSYKSKGTDRYGRTREKYDGRTERYRGKSGEKDSPKNSFKAEDKLKLDTFREEFNTIECAKQEKLKYYEKNPEKHPNYPSEWKSFWNRRYNELQRSGMDPSKHDFKPEWISFWTKRMKELYEEDLRQSKEDLLKKFNLPEKSANVNSWSNNPRKHSPGLIDISPPTPDKKDVIADIKTTWKAFTGSDIKDTPKRPLSPWEEDNKSRDLSPHSKKESRRHMSKSRSPSPFSLNEKLLEDMPQRKSRTSPLIFVLRKLTVLEHELGSSLAPKVFDLMSQALAYEKIKEEASLDLLLDSENCVFLETVREKLIALLCAGVVPRNMVNTSRSAIKHIDIALYLSTKRQRSIPITSSIPISHTGVSLTTTNAPLNAYITPVVLKSEPVVVPGVGQVDKAAIAQQIAAALIEQGKTNVTEAELEQLINAVVGMAEASVNSAKPMTTANFLHQLQSIQNSVGTIKQEHTSAVTATTSTNQFPNQQFINQASGMKTGEDESQSQPAFGALKLLQSAYNDTNKSDAIEYLKPEAGEIKTPNTKSISDEELAAVLATFNKTSREDQPSLINKLKLSNPEMYKRLCPFIPSHDITPVEKSPKRTPISICLSKERSEQKIKPALTGRLSPFSSRPGGTNPSNTEKVVIEDDEDVTEVKLRTDSQSIPTESNPETSKYISDDDDDYSFEDVYRAAQEKLRQKQTSECTESTHSKTQEQININTKSDKALNTIVINVDNFEEGLSSSGTWNLRSYENTHNNSQSTQYPNVGTTILDLNQSTFHSKMFSEEDNTTAVQEGSLRQSHSSIPHGASSSYYESQYLNESSHPKLVDKYDRCRSYDSRVSQDPKYLSEEAYSQYGEELPISFIDSYSSHRGTSAYRSHTTDYAEYARYCESSRLEGYSQGRSHVPPYSDSLSYRYQSPNYPPY